MADRKKFYHDQRINAERKTKSAAEDSKRLDKDPATGKYYDMVGGKAVTNKQGAADRAKMSKDASEYTENSDRVAAIYKTEETSSPVQRLGQR